MFRMSIALLSVAVLSLGTLVPQVAAAPPATADLTVTVPVYKNTTCPIMGKPASNRLFVDLADGRLYICCLPCVKKIKANPTKAMSAAYPVEKLVGNTVCPVTGKALPTGHSFVKLQGYKIGVFDASAQATARKHHQATLAMALIKGAVDVKNAMCPIAGKPVSDNFICMIGKNIVHLSSMRVLSKVRKAPGAALAKAVASAKSTTR